MSCEHLVCARCSGPVVEGRCPTCRASKERVHVDQPFGVSTQTLVLVALVVTMLVLLALHA